MSVARCEVAGFEAFTVSGRRLSMTCVPGRGAHLTALRAGSHEWLSVPSDGPALAPVAADGCFDPHQEGADDCLPTVAPAVVDGVALPDHGAVWHRPWRVLRAVDRLELSIDLPAHHLACARAIIPDGDGLRLSWRLTSHAPRPVSYIWCWHPLFAWRPGDRLELPGAQDVWRGRGVRLGPWPDPLPGCRLDLGELGGRPHLKCFVRASGCAVLRSCGQALELRWDPLLLPWIGLWNRRDPGPAQWAVEPSNLRGDRPVPAASCPAEGVIPPGGERCWSIRLQPL